MATYLRALLGKVPQVISARSRDQMLRLRWLETGLGNKVSAGQFYGMGVRDLSAQLSTSPLNAINPELFFAGLLYGHDGASAIGFNSFNVYAPRYDFGISFIMNDVRGIGMFSFLARKIYDLSSKLTKAVE